MTGSARARAEAIRVALEYRPLPYQDLRVKADAALDALLAELDARTAALQDAREALVEIREELSRPETAGPVPATLAEHCALIASRALARLDGGREHHEKEG